MRRLLTTLVLVIAAYGGYRYISVSVDVHQLMLDYQWVVRRFKQVSFDRGPDGISQGAFGLPWGLTPAEVERRLGEPDLREWIESDTYQMTYDERGLRLLFDAPHRSLDTARLFSMRGRKDGVEVLPGLHVGLPFERFRSALGMRAELRAGEVEIKLDQVTILLRCYRNEECKDVSFTHHKGRL